MRQQFKTDYPGPLHPNGSLWVMGITLMGSLVFGWLHQLLWLIVPPIAFIGYAFLEVGRTDAWAKREMDLTGRQVADAWISGRSFRGYGRFMFGNPLMNFFVFGATWVAPSFYSHLFK
jgi:hypothetical protein